jgi:hypothetical protein
MRRSPGDAAALPGRDILRGGHPAPPPCVQLACSREPTGARAPWTQMAARPRRTNVHNQRLRPPDKNPAHGRQGRRGARAQPRRMPYATWYRIFGPCTIEARQEVFGTGAKGPGHPCATGSTPSAGHSSVERERSQTDAIGGKGIGSCDSPFRSPRQCRRGIPSSAPV